MSYTKITWLIYAIRIDSADCDNTYLSSKPDATYSLSTLSKVSLFSLYILHRGYTNRIL